MCFLKHYPVEKLGSVILFTQVYDILQDIFENMYWKDTFESILYIKEVYNPTSDLFVLLDVWIQKFKEFVLELGRKRQIRNIAVLVKDVALGHLVTNRLSTAARNQGSSNEVCIKTVARPSWTAFGWLGHSKPTSCSTQYYKNLP